MPCVFKCMLISSWKGLGSWVSGECLVPDVPDTMYFWAYLFRHRHFPPSPRKLRFLVHIFFPPCFSLFFFPSTSLLLCLLCAMPPFQFQWYFQSRFLGCFLGSCPAASTEVCRCHSLQLGNCVHLFLWLGPLSICRGVCRLPGLKQGAGRTWPTI